MNAPSYDPDKLARLARDYAIISRAYLAIEPIWSTFPGERDRFDKLIAAFREIEHEQDRALNALIDYIETGSTEDGSTDE